MGYVLRITGETNAPEGENNVVTAARAWASTLPGVADARFEGEIGEIDLLASTPEEPAKP